MTPEIINLIRLNTLADIHLRMLELELGDNVSTDITYETLWETLKREIVALKLEIKEQ